MTSFCSINNIKKANVSDDLFIEIYFSNTEKPQTIAVMRVVFTYKIRLL